MTAISAPTVSIPVISPDPADDGFLVARARYTRVMTTIAAISGSAAVVVAAIGLVVITH